MKSLKIIGMVTAVLVIFGCVLAWLEIRRGFSAHEQPSFVDTFLVTTARKLAVPFNYRRLTNPFPSSPANIQEGMEHFADHCATCHANNGSGDTMFGKGLYPKPPDMRKSETQNKTDGELYYTIENGVRLSGMPAFGEEHEDSETWKLALFIRHLPQLTAEEAKEMERFNPKSEADREEEQKEERFLNGGNPPNEPKKEHHQ